MCTGLKEFFHKLIYSGNITIVLYEDPPDRIPKIHVRSKKYMAWIAEMMLPTYLHVEKVTLSSFDFISFSFSLLREKLFSLINGEYHILQSLGSAIFLIFLSTPMKSMK